MMSKIKIILAGRTGAGKSTVGNYIANETIFQVGNRILSETGDIEERDCFLGRNQNYPITLVDTAGSYDNRITKRLLANTLGTVSQAQKGFNLVLFCVNGTNARFDNTDIEDLRNLVRRLTKDAIRHIYIVITRLDMVFPSKREEIIANYKQDLMDLLKDNRITGFSNDQLLFFDSNNSESLVLELVNILPQKSLFRAYTEVDLSNPLKAFANPKVKVIVKSIIEDLKTKINSLNEFQDEDTKRHLKVLELQKNLLEIIIQERGKDLKTILLSIKHTSTFCQELADFFLSTDANDQDSVYGLAHKMTTEIESTNKETYYLKKEYAKMLQDQLGDDLLAGIEQTLSKMIYKHLRRTIEFDEGASLDASIGAFPVEGLIAGLSLGGVSSYLSSTLVWAVEGVSTVSSATFAATATGVTAGVTGGVVEAGAAAVGTTSALGAAAVAGTGLLVGLGVLGASFFVWTRNGVIADMAQATRDRLLEAQISMNLVFSVLLTFCDIATQLDL